MKRRFSKRCFDLALALPAVVLLAPVLVLLAVLVRWKLGSPVFFCQERPGLRGKPFTMLKFRTLTDAHDAHGNLLPDRDRTTPFGQWLRRTSLDELPELLNVIKGEMSLVGPRPLLMRYLPLYSPEQMRRHDVPPGITGLAQVNGRNHLTWEEKFALDLKYVDTHSVALDFKILVATVRAVIHAEGISAPQQFSAPEFMGSKGPAES